MARLQAFQDGIMPTQQFVDFQDSNKPAAAKASPLPSSVKPRDVPPSGFFDRLHAAGAEFVPEHVSESRRQNEMEVMSMRQDEGRRYRADKERDRRIIKWLKDQDHIR